MYPTHELAGFALSEFQRGLEGLTEEEVQTRTAKADGTQMNAISWIVGHIASHWLSVAAYATQGEPPTAMRERFLGRNADPTPPSLSGALQLLGNARAATEWTSTADDALLSTTCRDSPVSRQGNVGTALMRAILHTWFHAGEINSVRQMLGHAEIPFVGTMVDKLEWRDGRGADDATDD